MGLYAEQLSGTPFTYSKVKNQRSWLYRIMPTVKHGPWSKIEESLWVSNFSGADVASTPEQLRWGPMTPYKEKVQFYQGVETMMGTGSPDLKNGMSISRF